jgi:hypothetical protein
MIAFQVCEQVLQPRKQGWGQRGGRTQYVGGWMQFPVDCAGLCPCDMGGEEKELMVLLDNVSQKDKIKLQNHHSPGVKAHS